MFNLTKKILKPVSVSGREEAVVGVIAEEIAPYVDSLRTDAMGNLIAFKAGTAENKKKVNVAKKLLRQQRVNFITPADYTKESRTYKVVCSIIDKIRADFELAQLAKQF